MADTDPSEGLDWFVFPVCICSGVSMTLSAVVLAYPAHQEAKTGIPNSKMKKGICAALNLAFTGCGVFLGQIYAVKFGPVAVCFPIAAGANLLSNMLIQALLGMAVYTKNMVVGTLVLTCAVTTIKDIGPGDVGEMSNEEVLKMLGSASSLMFVGIGALTQGFAMYALWQLLKDNNLKLFAYAYVGGVGTVMNGAIGKLASMELGPGFKVLLGIAYVVFSIICLGVAMMANGTLEDPSRFVPVSAGLNLVLTCLGGLCIWGDGARIAFPMTYGLVYFMVLLAIYDISTFDFGARSDDKTASLIQQMDPTSKVFRSFNNSEMSITENAQGASALELEESQ